MILLDSWNSIYRVRFKEGAKQKNQDFDSKDEAVGYAEELKADKPSVFGVEVYIDDLGNITEEGEPELILAFFDEPEQVAEPEVDALAAKLSELETTKDLEPEITAEQAEQDESEEFDPIDLTTELDELEPEQVESEELDPLFGNIEISDVTEADPLAQDFVEISKDEAELQNCEDCKCNIADAISIDDLIKNLGLENEVYTCDVESEPEIPEVSKIELVQDDAEESEFPEPVKDIEIAPAAVDFTLGEEPVETEINKISEPAEKTEVIMSAEVPADVINNISEDDIKVQIPVDDIEGIASEEAAQAEQVVGTDSTIEVKPEVISVEAKKEAELEESVEPDYHDYRIRNEHGHYEVYDGAKLICTEDTMPEAVQAIADLEKESAEQKNAEFNKPLAEETEKERRLKLGAEFKQKFEAGLIEDTHASEAKPELDKEKAYEEAKKLADKSKKPVIYGYMGSNHHGAHRYYEIEPIICDDLKKCTADVMSKYSPSGSVLVAYAEVSESDDITDIELVTKLEEARQKRLEEAANSKKYNVNFAEAEFDGNILTASLSIDPKVGEGTVILDLKAAIDHDTDVDFEWSNDGETNEVSNSYLLTSEFDWLPIFYAEKDNLYRAVSKLECLEILGISESELDSLISEAEKLANRYAGYAVTDYYDKPENQEFLFNK